MAIILASYKNSRKGTPKPAAGAAQTDAVDVAVDFMDEYADVFRELAK